jgi:nitrogen-specific signal transduction histidine kinase
VTIPDHLEGLYRLALADEVSAHQTHALRNVLGGIAASAFFLRKRLERERLLDVDERIGRALDVIERNVQNGAPSTPRRLPLAVSSATELVLSEVVEALLAAMPAPDGVTMILAPVASKRTVLASREVLELALACLVENASEAVASKGRGTIELRIDDVDDACRIEVHDDAPGIDAPDLDNVTRPLFSTTGGHVGLGLTIARRLVADLGGSLELASDARGVRAALIVPARPARDPR